MQYFFKRQPLLLIFAILLFMFIDVKLISGFSKPLTYKVPEGWDTIIPGTLVRVPLRSGSVVGLITQVYEKKVDATFEIKEAFRIEKFPHDPLYFNFLKKLSTYHAVDEVHFIKRIASFLREKESPHLSITGLQETQNADASIIELTKEQKTVVESLTPHIQQSRYIPTVLHGVTGSGKTEVYKQLILCAFTEKKSSLLLLPEVSLALQFEKILRKQLPTTLPLFSFHSATTQKTKECVWTFLMEQKPFLLIGVHIPILLPHKKLGLIIIDEEHETGFQEKKHPKLNTKQAALLRAQQYNIPIVLGSATPSLTSLYNVQKREWHFFQLKKRFTGAFPQIELISLADKKQRRNFWISEKLFQEISTCLATRKQCIIFLNRRGVCFFIQCKSCSFIFQCNSCSVSLTLHEDMTLRCHYCNYKRPYPDYCNFCKETEFLKKGVGTEQIITILKKLFPHARIGKADLDVTSNKKAWIATVHAFENQQLDILVGTQTITKGYHFPNVTLVGIIWADINLNFPFYNAQECTLQQLIQVAGRAGRENKESKVIVQTMTNHRIFSYLNESDYLTFYDEELAFRKAAHYPPFIRFAEIELKHKKDETVEKEAFFIASYLIQFSELTVLGPIKPPVAKIKKINSRKIYLKAKSFFAIQQAIETIHQKKIRSQIFFTPDPLN